MPRRPFNTRAFITLVVAISGVGLPVTGVANHYYGFDPITVARHAWMSAHNVLGVIFVVFATWHVILNRRALWSHARGAASRIPTLSREALFAALLVAGALTFFVGHSFHAGRTPQ
jgi:hypothetical protein